MKTKDEIVRFILGMASNLQEREHGFVIAYPDDSMMSRYIDEYGEPLQKVPEGTTVIQAQNKEQADLWVWLYEGMGDSFIVGKEQFESSQPVIKLTDNLAIAI
jgi:hypothetical protein